MHNIYLYKDLSGETFDWDIDIDMFSSIKVKNVEELRDTLIKENIGVGIHYHALHACEYYSQRY